MIVAGKLDRRITVERETGYRNGLNEQVSDWFALTTLWAMRRDVSDGEQIAAGQLGGSALARFTVRSSDKTRQITTADRLQAEGQVWSIKGVKPTNDGRRRFIEITAAVDTDG